MRHSKSILYAAVLSLFFGVSISQAEVRDAGSKIQGNFDHFDRQSQSHVSSGYSRNQSTAEQRMMTAQAPATRAFSYETPRRSSSNSAAPVGAAAQGMEQPKQPTAVRRFSYEPSVGTLRQTYAPSRSWHRNVRDAESKVRGNY